MLRVMYGAHFPSVLLLFLPCCLASSHNEVFEGPSNITYCATANDLPIELTCRVSGVAAWIVNKTRYTLDQINQTLEGHDRNGTNILVYSPASNTKYTCVSLTNDDDVRSDPAYITVIEPPTTAPNITGTTLLSSTSFTVSWTITDPNYNYIITWTNLCTDMMEDIMTIPENTNSYTVTGLNGIDNYNVSVTANNSCGMMSDPITVYDLQISAPMNIVIPADNITSESFIVQWDAVTELAVTYGVRWYGEDGNNGTATVNGLSYTVTGLTALTSYNVTVVAINTCYGAGPVSDVVMVMTNMRPITAPPTSTSPPVTTPTGGNNITSDDDDDGSNTGAIAGGVVSGIVAVIVVVVIVIVVYCCYFRDKDSTDDTEGLKSPTSTGGTHTASIKPAVNAPHRTAASGGEYAVATTKPVTTKPQQPTEEYAMVDKTKKHAAAAQGIHYADLQDLPASGNKPPTNQGPTATYAQVA